MLRTSLSGICGGGSESLRLSRRITRAARHRSGQSSLTRERRVLTENFNGPPKPLPKGPQGQNRPADVIGNAR
jgi:hypothetical protein